jgi:hypothetical protein
LVIRDPEADLVAAVLGAAIVRRAVQLDVLLREGSPLALVRAVELAEVVLRSNAELGGWKERSGRPAPNETFIASMPQLPHRIRGHPTELRQAPELAGGE